MLVIKNSKQKNRSAYHFFDRWKRQIGYAWRNVFNDFFQHKLSSLLTMTVIAISITLPSISYLLWKNANEAAQQWYPTPNLTIYINKTVNQASTSDLLNKLKTLPEVEKVTYLSQDQAREEFKEWSGFSSALNLLDENPLPAVAIIMPKDYAKNDDVLHKLQSEFSKMDGVDDVRLDNSWFTRLTALTDMIKTIVWIISIFMTIAVSLVIGNSIRLMIFSRRETIIVMQLIGATEGFILRPFLYSGLFIGLASAIVALVLSEIFILLITSVLLNVSTVFGAIFTIKGLSLDESVLIILLTMIIGWLSAFAATKKYLKIAHIA